MIRQLLLIAFLFLSIGAFAQQKITGLVEDDETGSAVSFASVTSERGEGLMTDSLGKFSVTIRKQSRLNDSLLVTAIGYTSKKILVRDLLKNHKIKLAQTDKTLAQVKVYASLKGDYRQFGYYREWNFNTTTLVENIDSKRSKRTKKGNGEIGYVFDMPGRKFQVQQVQVKVNHNYDTCWVKLHLRDVPQLGLNLPGDDLLKKEVVLPVTLKYGLVEFDLNSEPIEIAGDQVYVGFELQRCGCSTSEAPSFFFMGSNEGFNFYRENEQVIWKRGGEHTIYIRLITK